MIRGGVGFTETHLIPFFYVDLFYVKNPEFYSNE